MLRSQPFFVLMLLLTLVMLAVTPAQGESADERARATEEQMTDDERFSLIISLFGALPSIGVPRDKRIPPEVTNMSAGYTPGLPRLGVPALQSSDASMGVTNPGYRPDDKGATAFPASILIGSSFNPKLARLQHHAGRGDQSRPRRAQRAELQVLFRGSARERPLRRRGRERDPKRGRYLDAQALHAQLQRNQPALARRHH